MVLFSESCYVRDEMSLIESKYIACIPCFVHVRHDQSLARIRTSPHVPVRLPMLKMCIVCVLDLDFSCRFS